MADDKKSTRRQRLPKIETPLRSTTRWIAERAARQAARNKQLEIVDAYLASGPFSRSLDIPGPSTPFETQSEIMSENRPEFDEGASNTDLAIAGPSTRRRFDVPPFEGSNLIALQQPGALEHLRIQAQRRSREQQRNRIAMQAKPKTPSAGARSASK